MVTKEHVELFNNEGRTFDALVKVCSNYDLDQLTLLDVLDDLSIDHSYCDPDKHNKRILILTNIKKAKEAYENKTHSIYDVATKIMHQSKTSTLYYLHLVNTKIRSKSESTITTFKNHRSGNAKYSSGTEKRVSKFIEENTNFKINRQEYIEEINRFADITIPELNLIIEVDGFRHYDKDYNVENTKLRNKQYIDLGYNLLILNAHNCDKFNKKYLSVIFSDPIKYCYPFDIDSFDKDWYNNVWKPDSLAWQYGPGGVYYQKLDQSNLWDHSFTYDQIMDYVNKFPIRSITIDNIYDHFKCNIHKIQARIRLSAPDDLKDYYRWEVYYCKLNTIDVKRQKIMLEFTERGIDKFISTYQELVNDLKGKSKPQIAKYLGKVFGLVCTNTDRLDFRMKEIYGKSYQNLIRDTQ